MALNERISKRSTKRRPRHKKRVFYEPTDNERRLWKAGRRARFLFYRWIWVNTQPHSRVKKTVWKLTTSDGTTQLFDETGTIFGMIDFICVLTGIKTLVTPPCQPSYIYIGDYLAEDTPAEIRAFLESFPPIDLPPVYIPTKTKYPKVVYDYVREKWHKELSNWVREPQKYGREEYDNPVFSPLSGIPARFIEEFDFLESRVLRLNSCEPFFQTSGDSRGEAEKQCIIKVLEALDGITPMTRNWWKPAKRGNRDYYRYASYLRFVLYEALLWYLTTHEPHKQPNEVTVSEFNYYLELFEEEFSDEQAIHNKLRKLNLPRWSDLIKESADFACITRFLRLLMSLRLGVIH